MTHMYGRGKLTTRNINESMLSGVTPWQVGSQQRFNHKDCPAGADTKRRLYVKRPMDDPYIMIAYCHNCGCSGMVKERTSSYRGSPLAQQSLVDKLSNCNTNVKPPTKWSKQAVSWDQKFPPHYVPATELHNWERRALRWFLVNGISDKEMQHYEYHYDPSEARVWHPIYPVRHRDGVSVPDDYKRRIGAQGRAVGAASRGTGAKYLSLKVDAASTLETHLVSGPGDTDLEPMLVICEDYLSAIRLVEPDIRLNLTAVPLFGSHMRTEYLFDMVKKNPLRRIVIWLDNDNETVQQESLRLVGALGMIGVDRGRICHITDKTEPKHLTLEQLNKILAKMYHGTFRSDGKLNV